MRAENGLQKPLAWPVHLHGRRALAMRGDLLFLKSAPYPEKCKHFYGVLDTPSTLELAINEKTQKGEE